MKKEHLFEPYSISVQTLDTYPVHEHQHTFFELVYVISGSGFQRINQNKFEYQPGDVFLIAPHDSHCFDIKESTSFFFLRFNDIYLKTNGIIRDNIQRLEYILMNANHRPGPIIKNETDKPFVRATVEAMIREQVNRDVCWDKINLQLVNTLIAFVARNIEKYLPEELNDDKEEKAFDILQYIQANIYSPNLIKAENVGKEFGISQAYLGRYFKKHTGKTMQDYIASYKTKLIENRLLHSTMRISEIVDELGFSDESHLNKFFKKNNGVTPSEFRRR
ncbi:AraC-type DNA-binding protein [Dyadobacter soli]|uniref:AraC-type DNA-binding protein n=1 Tax=Dyadobacter soli TaxID=659014 RepID=A0A1G7AEE6_9BACT|nr:helix-turn-helix domain-containing protein [Dyadobacter soli]SDE12236.1 AraC-type DNA-binding protein [Dyadobacter soli]